MKNTFIIIQFYNIKDSVTVMTVVYPNKENNFELIYNKTQELLDLKSRLWGIDDGQILEANQIIGYFNYANRCLNGLGVSTDGDIVGFYSET